MSSPITPQNTGSITPNAVLVPNVMLTTRIVSGALKTSAMVTLQAATVDGSGNWTAVGTPKTIQLADVSALPSDIASCQTAVNTVEADLIAAINAINAIRKLV